MLTELANEILKHATIVDDVKDHYNYVFNESGNDILSNKPKKVMKGALLSGISPLGAEGALGISLYTKLKHGAHK